MSEIVSFPGLGLSFEISRVAFSIGNYSIYWYGITFAGDVVLSPPGPEAGHPPL